MRTIKEMEEIKKMCNNWFEDGIRCEKERVLELINELDKDNMGVIIKEELKKRITG